MKGAPRWSVGVNLVPPVAAATDAGSRADGGAPPWIFVLGVMASVPLEPPFTEGDRLTVVVTEGADGGGRPLVDYHETIVPMSAYALDRCGGL